MFILQSWWGKKSYWLRRFISQDQKLTRILTLEFRLLEPRGINCCSATQYVGFYCNSTRQWDRRSEVQTNWFNNGDGDACVRGRLPHFPRLAAQTLPPHTHSSTPVFTWDCSFLPRWPYRSCLLSSPLPSPHQSCLAPTSGHRLASRLPPQLSAVFAFSVFWSPLTSALSTVLDLSSQATAGRHSHWADEGDSSHGSWGPKDLLTNKLRTWGM